MPANPTGNIAHQVPEYLQYLDYRLLWIGGLVIIGLMLWFAHSRPRNPLAGPSHRKNNLPPEMFILPFLVFIFVGVIASEASKAIIGPEMTDGTRQTIFCAGWLAGIAACLFLGYRYFEGGIRRYLFGNTSILTSTASGILYFLASLPLVTGAYFLGLFVIKTFVPDYELNDHSALKILHDATEPDWVRPWIWISALAFAPIGEECFFRGILQSIAIRYAGNRWIAIAIISVIFGAAHASQLHAIFPLAVFGFVLGFSCERTGTLWTPMIIHFLFNLKSMVWDSMGAAG